MRDKLLLKMETQWSNSPRLLLSPFIHLKMMLSISWLPWFVVQSLSRVWLFVTLWTAAHQSSPSFTISQSLLKLTSIESVMPSNHLVLCCHLLFLPSIFPSIRVFSNELFLCSRWPKSGASASASVLPVNIQGGFPLGIDWFDLFTAQGTLKSLL